MFFQSPILHILIKIECRCKRKTNDASVRIIPFFFIKLFAAPFGIPQERKKDKETHTPPRKTKTKNREKLILVIKYFGAQLLAESSMVESTDASGADAVTVAIAVLAAAEVWEVDNGAAGASEPAFGFVVRDFSRGPCPPLLTLIFRHLSYVSRQ